MEGLLWLSERYRWFWFNEKKGWTVLIGVAVVGGTMLVMLLWLIASLVFRWRFQFSIRSLLLLTVAVAIPFSWLAVEIRQARREREVVAIEKLGGRVFWSEPSGPPWLRRLLGDGLFITVEGVGLGRTKVTDAWLDTLKGLNELQRLSLDDTEVTDAGLEYLKGLNQLQWLYLDETKVTDAGLENLTRLKQLQMLSLDGTKVTEAGVKKLQQALPNCKIWH